MSSFELPEAPKPRRKTSALVWNVLTILLLVTMLCVVSVFLLIYVDPNSNLNPFPPPTLFPSVPPPTYTITPRFTLVPTWTPTIAPQMVSNVTATQIPEDTSTPTEAPIVIKATSTPSSEEFAFMPQQGSPSAITMATFHPDAGCEWTAIAGQATSMNGESVKGLFVRLGGSIPGSEAVEKVTMTGLADVYGPGGFEFIIANSLIASSGTLWIQLLDQQDLPISDRVYFDTYADCEKNLIIIYFDQVN